MKKQMSAVFLLAGTAIGSGMIALPMVLSHIGAIYTLLLILFCSIMTYFSALIRTELNLHSDSKFTLEDVGYYFSGKKAALIGNISFKVLSFSLLAAYVYGLGSLLYANNEMKIIPSIVVFIILTFSSHWIMNFNRRLFAVLLIAILLSIILMIINIDFTTTAIQTSNLRFNKLCIILPTVFTSFGFQGSLHTLTNFCNNDRKLIKSACFFGSLIPATVYICWTLCIIFVLSKTQPNLFLRMATSGIDINEFINALCNVANSYLMKSGIFIISLLVMLTSTIGVGIALVEDLEMTFKRIKQFQNIRIRFLKNKQLLRISCSLITIIPATIIAICIPGAFVNILSFAGMILSIIAIFLPIYLFSKLKDQNIFKVLKNKWIIVLLSLFGILILLCECFNLLVA